jgi:Delta6-protoilludene synthase
MLLGSNIPYGKTNTMAAVKVKLPDFLDTWPWQRELNPHYEVAKREANEWAHSFGFFDAKSQDAFDRCEFGECRSVQSATPR